MGQVEYCRAVEHNGQVGMAAGDGDGFGELVRGRRSELGLTIEQLAERTGLSVRAISDIERGRTGRPRRSSVGLLAEVLGIARPTPIAELDAPGPQAELPRPITPRQLPAAVPALAGRSAELAALTGLLGPADAGRGSVQVAVLSGMAGAGKTALAVHWAHAVADRFPDGQLYTDLRGFSPAGRPAAPGDVLHGFIEALGVPAVRIPAEAGARAGLYRSLLAGRRVLVVLDNAADAAQVRRLLPAGPGCAALVTSRGPLTGLVVTAGARPVPLDVLTEAGARELLAARLGTARVAAEPRSAELIIELTGRLPLALAIVAARAAAHPGCPLEVLAGELRDARDRLQALSADGPSADVRAALSWSCRRLTVPAARMFRLLSIHPGTDVTIAAAASVAGSTPHAARAALAELTAAGLATQTAPSRFARHDLARDFAAEQSRSRDSGSVRQDAISRMLDHYLHTAHTAAGLIRTEPVPLVLPPVGPGVWPERLGTESEAMSWLAAEHHVLLELTAGAARGGLDTYAWMLPVVMAAYLNRVGYWDQCAEAQRAALAAAQRLDDPHAQARAHRCLGSALTQLGQTQDAHAHLTDALTLWYGLRDQAGQAQAHAAFASLMCWQKRSRDAIDHTRLALRLYRAAGNTLGQAICVNNMGWDYMQLGDYQRAVKSSRRALRLGRLAGSHTITGHAWDTLGLTHHLLGQHAKANACYQQAISEYRQAGHQSGEGGTLGRLGDTQHCSGNRVAAMASWHQALEIFTSLRDPAAEAIRTRLAQERGHPGHDGDSAPV